MVKKKISVLHPAAGEPIRSQRPFSKVELAEFASVSTRLIEMEVAAGRLRSVIIGGHTVRFLVPDVDKWLNARPSIKTEEAA